MALPKDNSTPNRTFCMAEPASPPALETVGANPTRLWGLSMTERNHRIGVGSGLGGTGAPVVLANAGIAADPAWLGHVAAQPGLVLTLGGVPAIAHARDEHEAALLRAAMREGTQPAEAQRFVFEPYEDGATIENRALRKRERPFLMELRPDTRRAAERASYFGAYKGVTDLLTKYLWPEWALWLTRLAAWLGVSPNMVTAIGTVLCVAATVAFAFGQYGIGLGLGLVFMVLDTVDGKLARVTGASSKWGEVLDHGIDLIHPPFWWWAWEHGLAAYGRPLHPFYATMILWAIIGGYVAQRVIEGLFIKRFNGMHIHVWRPIDSKFRLITARRNPNMVILVAALLFQRPDTGLKLVAWWTIISLIFHAVRLAQASERAARGQPVTSWLA